MKPWCRKSRWQYILVLIVTSHCVDNSKDELPSFESNATMQDVGPAMAIILSEADFSVAVTEWNDLWQAGLIHKAIINEHSSWKLIEFKFNIVEADSSKALGRLETIRKDVVIKKYISRTEALELLKHLKSSDYSD
jgi:hypothetical protein